MAAGLSVAPEVSHPREPVEPEVAERTARTLDELYDSRDEMLNPPDAQRDPAEQLKNDLIERMEKKCADREEIDQAVEALDKVLAEQARAAEARALESRERDDRGDR